VHTSARLEAIVAAEHLLLLKKFLELVSILDDFLANRSAEFKSFFKAQLAWAGVKELIDVSIVKLRAR